MEVVRPRASYADLERAPEDGRRYELYDGEIFVVPSPLPRHQIVVKAIVKRFDAYVDTHGGLALESPLDIVFSQFDVVQPDIVFFQASRREHVQLDAPIRHAPDIAVEVLAPSTAATDRGKKMQMLARYGVAEYWIADPLAARIEIYSLRGSTYSLVQRVTAGDTVRSVLLPDFAFPAASVFPR